MALPFVSLAIPWSESSWSDSFATSLSDAAGQRAAAIAVERVNGPVLFISGTDDRVWPCSTMADLAMERLRHHRFPFASEHAKYEGGGHAILVPPYRVGAVENPGGITPIAVLAGSWNFRGWEELSRGTASHAWPRMTAFLARHL